MIHCAIENKKILHKKRAFFNAQKDYYLMQVSNSREFTGYFAEIQFLTVISSYNRIALELNILIATSADICDN